MTWEQAEAIYKECEKAAEQIPSQVISTCFSTELIILYTDCKKLHLYQNDSSALRTEINKIDQWLQHKTDSTVFWAKNYRTTEKALKNLSSWMNQFFQTVKNIYIPQQPTKKVTKMSEQKTVAAKAPESVSPKAAPVSSVKYSSLWFDQARKNYVPLPAHTPDDKDEIAAGETKRDEYTLIHGKTGIYSAKPPFSMEDLIILKPAIVNGHIFYSADIAERAMKSYLSLPNPANAQLAQSILAAAQAVKVEIKKAAKEDNSSIIYNYDKLVDSILTANTTLSYTSRLREPITKLIKHIADSLGCYVSADEVSALKKNPAKELQRAIYRDGYQEFTNMSLRKMS